MSFIVLKSEYSNITDDELDVIIPVAVVDSYGEAARLVNEGNLSDQLHTYWELPLDHLTSKELEYFRAIMKATNPVIVHTLQNDFAIISNKQHYGPFTHYEYATKYCIEELGITYWDVIEIKEQNNA